MNKKLVHQKAKRLWECQPTLACHLVLTIIVEFDD